MAYARDYTSDAFAADFQDLFCHQLAASALAEGELCLAITGAAWNLTYAAACQSAARDQGANAFTTVFSWDMALARPELSPRELSVTFTDERNYFVSKASFLQALASA